jgi:NADPH-dependent glutamate synthase beta subunit-like oxidoreductase/coenzyme F420-reducing hydrogenase delta subunit/Pyruvate/2-oxoacid:ferredoxin oxidoreductase delta subunit
MAVPNPAKQFQKILSEEQAAITLSGHDDSKLIIGPINPSPCTQACPAGVNVKSYVSLIAAGRFEAALNVVRQRNPLPGICGRICTHPCETICKRSQIDAPVAISWLKRFVADWELAHPHSKPERIPQIHKEHVAIIGSGPAGLTAANDLIRNGYAVTVFESMKVLGGMLIAGIPAYRLPRNIIKSEIDAIKALGVTFKTGIKISGKNALNDLLKNDFNAVFIAIGAHAGKKLGIPGEAKSVGILDCVDFLRAVNLKKAPSIGNQVLVIGGGNSAIDSARTAVRLGSEKVTIVYRRSRKEMPANEAEIIETEREGIKIYYLAAPVRIISENGKMKALECVKMKLGKSDESGRRRPLPIPNSEFKIKADTIISAISQQPDLAFLDEEKALTITKWNTFAVDATTMETNRPGIFAGGDAVTGPNTVIDAIAQGHTAGDSIHRYLRGESLEPVAILQNSFETEIVTDLNKREKITRASMPGLEVPKRAGNFKEVELGFDEKAAISEAQRCLRCGPCSECHTCVPECEKVLSVLSSPNGLGEYLFRLPPAMNTIHNGDANWNGMISYRKRQFPLKVDPLFPRVKKDHCRGCGDCVEVCDYNAIEMITFENEIKTAQVDSNICRGCGTCVSVCSSGAMVPAYFNQDWLTLKLNSIQPDKTSLVVFSCQWNGSHIAGTAFPDFDSIETQIIFVHLMCSGRLEPTFVFQAFELGAKGVLVAGCSGDTCHYDFGSSQASKTIEKTSQLVHMLGIDPRRFQHRKIKGADTEKFAFSVNEFIQELKSLDSQTAEQIDNTAVNKRNS